LQAIESGFSALTAVHCADVLAHEAQNAAARVTADCDYLERLGLAARMEEWRRFQ
jgi:hypothetical protein